MPADDEQAAPSDEKRQPAAPDEPAQRSRRRPTAWIVTSCVLAVAAVGFAIWAFSGQSDADDAQDKLNAQQRTAGAATPTPEATEVDAETQQQFDEIAKDLGATAESVDAIQKGLEEASAKVEEAKQARADASGAVDAAKAEAEVLKAQAELARSCLQGTLDAVGAAFDSGGLEAAVPELQKLTGSCRAP